MNASGCALIDLIDGVDEEWSFIDAQFAAAYREVADRPGPSFNRAITYLLVAQQHLKNMRDVIDTVGGRAMSETRGKETHA